MKSYHHFPEALAAWRKLGGAMNYCCAFSDAPETWQVWEEVADLVEAIEIRPRDAMILALREGGLSEVEIAEEMADFQD